MVQTEIDIDLVKELRERTGAGFMACKRALEETGGDIEAAITLLREQGQAAAAGKAGREAREGQVASLHPHRWPRRACSSRSTARPTSSLGRTTSRSSSASWRCRSPASPPDYTTIESIPADVVEAKRAELAADQATQGKPAEIREKIVEGQLAKWYKEVVLYEQTFRDTEQTVGQLITDAIARIGENIRVRRFVRYAARGGAVTEGSRPEAAAASAAGARRYGRILLKLSGEALMGSRQYGVDPATCVAIARAGPSRPRARRRGRHRRRWRQHLPRPARPRPAAWSAPPATTWACSPRS